MSPMQHMANYAAAGNLALQCCTDCGTVQYPPRELCSTCLSVRLEWRVVARETGEVLAVTTLLHSHDSAFHDALPLRVGLIRLAPGPTAVCFLTERCEPGDRVGVTASTDKEGRAILTATPLQ